MFLFIRRNAPLHLLIIPQRALPRYEIYDVPVMSRSQEIPGLQYRQKEYLQVFLFGSPANGRWSCGPGTDLS